MENELDIRWIQRLHNYSKAVNRLVNAADIIAKGSPLGDSIDELLKEGLVQRFEYIQELAWKVMKDYEEYQGYTDIQGSRDAIRKALQMGIISDAVWMSTISARNLTSHCYDEEEFDRIFHRIIYEYLPAFTDFLQKMNAIKDTEGLVA